jgi:hypothetical protein
MADTKLVLEPIFKTDLDAEALSRPRRSNPAYALDFKAEQCVGDRQQLYRRLSAAVRVMAKRDVIATFDTD